MNTSQCPFCSPARPHTAENACAIAILDSNPLNPGHTLILPRRHVESYFELNGQELCGVWQLVRDVRMGLLQAVREQEVALTGFTIGINEGIAAGQTVDHVHIHVIPRFPGDVADPRGGVRWVIPKRAAYWKDEQTEISSQSSKKL